MTQEKKTQSGSAAPAVGGAATAGYPRMTRETLRKARTVYASVWAFLLLHVMLTEAGVLPEGYIRADAQVQYALQMLCILLTLCVTWASLSVFMVPYVRRQMRGSVRSLWNWSLLRLSLPVLTALLNGVVYYGLMNSASPLFCLLITYMALLLCWPRKPRRLYERNPM